MPDNTQILEFARKWLDKFQNPNTNYIELVDHYMADDCAALGFKMDCGNAFAEKYGDAVNNCDALKQVIDEITDIPLLGSAIYSQWRYFNHWAYSGAEILEPKNRSWFLLALERLEALSNGNNISFKGELRKLRLISYDVGWGLEPEPDDEIEQRITVNAEGRVWFSAYNYGKGHGQHQKGRSQIFKIEKKYARKLLAAVASYFSGDYEEVFATDIGMWELELTNTEGKIYKYQGSLCAEFQVSGWNLSDIIRNTLGMDDLYVFDGGFYDDDCEVDDEYQKHLIDTYWDASHEEQLERAIANSPELRELFEKHPERIEMYKFKILDSECFDE